MRKSKIHKMLFLFFVPLVVTGGVAYLITINQSAAKFVESKKKVEEFIQNDTLKRSSLNFLIENASDKYSVGRAGIKKPDLLFLKKRYLSKNIEMAIQQANKRMENKEFTTDQFLQYVLPYRIRHEELENWREIAIDSCRDCYNDTMIVHVKNINNKIKTGFQYGGSSPENQTFSEWLENRTGICFQMSEMAAFAMRANGLPVAIDFAKWSGSLGRHQWNSLIAKNRNYPFMGLESNPNEETTVQKFRGDLKNAAKYYRKTFLKYDDKFKNYNPKKIIDRHNYIDVTAEYCPDCKDLIINLTHEKHNNEVFFLCISEINRWIPVDFAFSENGMITFTDVCPNNVFVLKRNNGERLEYFKTPFTFNKLGEVNFLNADSTIQSRLQLTFDNSYYMELRKSDEDLGVVRTSAVLDSMYRYNFTARVNDTIDYTLLYWNNKWVPFSDGRSVNGTLVFENAPSNALYKLVDKNNTDTKEHRCFTVDSNNNQFFWSGN